MYNKTTDFILPLLGKNRLFYEPYLIDCYLKDESGLNGQYYFYVLLKYYGDKRFSEIEKYLAEHNSFRGSYDLRGGEYVMYILEIGEEFKDDFLNFLLGKYSLYSPEAQKLVRAGKKSDNPIHGVFEKAAALRAYWEELLKCALPKKAEVWGIVEQDKEIFTEELFNQMIHK